MLRHAGYVLQFALFSIVVEWPAFISSRTQKWIDAFLNTAMLLGGWVR